MNTKLGFRKLKEQQGKKKIDHPLAKYNNSGQVTCIVCNLPLKNELLWQPHLLSKKHKEAVSTLKLNASGPKIGSKKDSQWKEKESHGPPSKKRKGEGESTSYTETKAEIQSSQNVIEKEEKSTKNAKDASKNVLPADFFDKDISEEGASGNTDKHSEKANEKSKDMSEKLPEGFFDDAKMDAKVRKVEYIDKKEEEWEQFQKMIAEETKVSENLQAEEEEEMKVERDLDEYENLKQYLTRVEKLKKKRKEHSNINETHQNKSEDIDDTVSGESEEELDDILNWRAKKA